MKRTVFAGLFLTTALLASPVFAADDLCGANIQTIKDAQVSTNTNYDADAKKQLKKAEDDAIAAQKAGDTKKCIADTSKTISELKLGGSGSDGGAAK
jgi:hypothetical protein